MAIKAMFIGCEEPGLPGAARELASLRGWEVVYWCAMASSHAALSNDFPGAVLHDTLAAARGLPASDLADLPPRPPDTALLDELAPFESVAMQMMDRMGSGAAFTLAERRDHYHRLIGYWGAVLDLLEPTVAVFPVAPHMIYDYVLYLLCRQRGIATAMFEFVPAVPRLLMIQRAFEQGIDGLAELYAAKLAAHQGGEVSLSPWLEAALNKVQESYDQGAPWYMKLHAGKAGQHLAARSWKSRVSQVVVPSHALAAARKAGNFLLAPPPPNYTKLPGRRVDREPAAGLAWRMDRLRRGRIKRRAGRYYGLLAHRVDLDKPYVLAALHFQPERTTSPLGGRYVDQLLMLRLLSRWLPDGWRLYVKEAPAVFYPHVTKQPARSPEFYDQIAALPNAELVDMSHDTYEMVDRSRAVATVTGTIGWEAVLRGRPALTFGHPWYAGCEGIHFCAQEDGLRRALESVEAGEKPRPEAVRLFMQALEEISLGAFIEERFREAAGVEDQENRARLARALDGLVRGQLKG